MYLGLRDSKVVFRLKTAISQRLREEKRTLEKAPERPAQFAFLLLRILRREIGYNFLETRVAAQRIPGRVQFQVTIA